MSDGHPYEQLTPDMVIDAVESTGRLSDLRIFGLNSYENRVYQVGIEDSDPLIAKFYRPNRWTDQQIQEEHDFSKALFEQEIPVVPAMEDEQGKTLFEFKGFRFSLYRRQGGHAPELDNMDSLMMLGRLVARIHAVGAQQDFTVRPTLDIKSFGEQSYQFISEHFIPAELRTAYTSLCEDLLKGITELFQQQPIKNIRVHGDCHSGNILWRGDTPHFVDLDDCRSGPAIQDLWMLISGDRHEMQMQLVDIIEGYLQFRDLDHRELQLIEPLRTLRIIHSAAWLARRWDDPAFPRAFPWFNTDRYWEEHILALREQAGLLNEPALVV